MSLAIAAFAAALFAQAAAAAQLKHLAPVMAADRLEFRQFNAMDRSLWGIEPDLQGGSGECAPGTGSAVWGRGNALLGYSCGDSANGS